MKFIIIIYTTNKLTVVEMEDIRGVRLRKFKLRKIILGVRMHFHHTSSSRMLVMNHNWSATKQRVHPQSVAEISRHSVIDVCLLKANKRQCNGSLPVTVWCDVLLLTTPRRWAAWCASEGFFLALWPGSLWIRFTGGIFGFPRLVYLYSPRYSRGGRRGYRLPAPNTL